MDTRVLACTPLGSHLTTRWEVLTPLDLYVQILELETCGFSRLLVRDMQRKRGSLADR